MIGRLQKTVFDCPEPRELAAFYCEVLGMRVNFDIEDAHVGCHRHSARRSRTGLSASGEVGATEVARPRSPAAAPHRHQRFRHRHRRGGRHRARCSPSARGAETGFHVFLDPVGHPFCLVFGWNPTAADTDAD